MSIILDISDAIRDSISAKDSTINYSFNKIERVLFPYVFFYIPSFKIDKALNELIWSKVSLLCVVEYMANADNSNKEIWAFSDVLSEALENIKFKNTSIKPMNVEFKQIEDVLQMTFNLEFYVKKEETGELMQELEFTLKE